MKMQLSRLSIILLFALSLVACSHNDNNSAPGEKGTVESETKPKINATIGVTCTSTTQCGPEGTCIEQQQDGTYSDGYCTADCSDTTKSCPNGSSCQTIDGKKRCMKTCSNNNSCRTTGYTCNIDLQACVTKQAKPSPTPINATIGGACTNNSPCGPEGTCITQDSDNHFTDGYCTADCSDATKSCPNDSTCQTVGRTKRCMKTCSNNNDCRTTGYTCNTTLGICSPAQTTPIDATIGGECTRNRICGNEGICIGQEGNNYSGGYCTADCSDATKSCPNGSTCQTIDGAKRCMKTCSNNNGCRTNSNYICDTTLSICITKPSESTQPLTANIPDEVCEDDNNCNGGQKCIEIPNAGSFKGENLVATKLCTAECTDNPDICPSNSICQSAGEEKKFCFPKCNSNSQDACNKLPGLTCSPYEQATEATCHVKKMTGEECVQDSECAFRTVSKTDSPIALAPTLQVGVCLVYDANANKGTCEINCGKTAQCPSGSTCDKTIPGYPICRSSCTDQGACDSIGEDFLCKSNITIDIENGLYQPSSRKICYKRIESSNAQSETPCEANGENSCGTNSYCATNNDWCDRHHCYTLTKSYCTAYSYKSDACPDGFEKLAMQDGIGALTQGLTPKWINTASSKTAVATTGPAIKQLGICLKTCDAPGNNAKCPADYECKNIQGTNFCVPSMSIQRQTQ